MEQHAGLVTHYRKSLEDGTQVSVTALGRGRLKTKTAECEEVISDTPKNGGDVSKR
jgi:hypothetical protein